MRILISLAMYLLLINSIFVYSLPEMVEIPDGQYKMGSSTIKPYYKLDDDGVPSTVYEENDIRIESFKISKHEITFTEYFKFLNETNYKTIAEVEWLARNEKTLGADGYRKFFSVELYPNHPVTRIAYEDALMYCLWLQKKTGKVYRLPTEAEWELLPRGGQMILYPWGDEYRQLECSHSNEFIFDANFDTDISPVSKYQEDRSLFGVYGMFGNAMEWCLDAFDPEYYKRIPSSNPLQIIRKYDNNISVRGSVGYSIDSDLYNLKTRLSYSPVYSGELIGFRVVEEIARTILTKKQWSNPCFFMQMVF